MPKTNTVSPIWIGQKVQHKNHYFLTGQVMSLHGFPESIGILWDKPAEAENMLGPLYDHVSVDDLVRGRELIAKG